MTDLYCNDGRCPICETTNKVNKVQNGIHYYCRNGCYGFQTYKDAVFYCILKDSHYEYRPESKTDRKTIEDRALNEIMYWKENERYLVEILGE